MDFKRVTSSLLGFPLVLIVFLIGNKYVIDIFLAGIAILSMNEYFNAISKVAKPIKWVGYVSCGIIAVVHMIPEVNLSLVVALTVPTMLTILFAHIILQSNCNVTGIHSTLRYNVLKTP